MAGVSKRDYQSKCQREKSTIPLNVSAIALNQYSETKYHSPFLGIVPAPSELGMREAQYNVVLRPFTDSFSKSSAEILFIFKARVSFSSIEWHQESFRSWKQLREPLDWNKSSSGLVFFQEPKATFKITLFLNFDKHWLAWLVSQAKGLKVRSSNQKTIIHFQKEHLQRNFCLNYVMASLNPRGMSTDRHLLYVCLGNWIYFDIWSLGSLILHTNHALNV